MDEPVKEIRNEVISEKHDPALGSNSDCIGQFWGYRLVLNPEPA
jgi:hypothetical protein